MAFGPNETGVESAEPNYLYRINIGADQYRLTNADIDIVFAGTTYTSTNIKHSEVKATENNEANAITLTVPQDHDLAIKYQNTPPGQKGVIEIRKVHTSDFGTSSAFASEFNGYIASTTMRGNTECEFQCNPPRNDLQRIGPRYQFTHLCNHVWGDSRCKVGKDTYSFTATISAIDGDWITVDGATAPAASPIPRPDGYFLGGYGKIATPFGEDFRAFFEQDSDDLRLLLPFIDAEVGTTIVLYPGCAHDITTCFNKFNNVVNFGGFPYIPDVNAFESELR